ncbi:MAG: DUF5317 family protein [Coriobacteriia bacterium]
MLDGIVLGLVAGLLAKGSFANLKNVRLKGETAVFLLLIIQLGIPTLSDRLGMSHTLALAAWLGVMAGLVALALWNRYTPGIILAALGIAMNLLAIGLNAGMPVSTTAIAYLSGTAAPPEFDLLHEPLTDSTVAPILTDIIPVPGPTWHRGIASIGDLVLMFGAGYFVFASMRGEKVLEG